MNNWEDKTVRIPIRVINGEIKYFYGGELPLIENGVIGELILPEYSIKDERFIQVSQMEEKVEFLKSETSIAVGISKKSIPEDKKKFLLKIPTVVWTTDSYVQVELLEPLFLLIRGSKKSTLSNVKCYIPSLQCEADSINSAYSIISQAFETHRRSHTGNVFEKCFFQYDDLWYSLDFKRDIEEGTYEENLFLDYKLFEINKSTPQGKDGYSELESRLIDAIKDKGLISGKEIKNIFDNDKNRYISVINDLIDRGVIVERKE